MANYINKYLNQSAYDADSTKQYPNTSLVGNEIVFQMEEPAFDGIIATYNVTSTENQTKLLGDTGNISKIWIDGVEQTEVSGSYQFSTTGEHEVKYTLIDQTTIGGYAFQNCSDLTSITIPDTVTSIGSHAFDNCTNLTSVTIPDSVTNIGYSAFYRCTKLATVTIGNGVTSIGDDAFYKCTKLATVTIGNGVTSIGENAFESCSSLTSVTIQATTPPTIEYGTFMGLNDYPIYVPTESVDAYKAADNWSDYASRIQAIPE